MPNVIWKYPVEVADRFTVPMPSGAKVLSVAMQAGRAYFWAMVDPTLPLTNRQFALVGTGQPGVDEVAEWGTFVGTVLLYEGTLVFHLFEMPYSITVGGDLNDE